MKSLLILTIALILCDAAQAQTPTASATVKRNCGASTWTGSDAGARINDCMASLAGSVGEAVIPAGTYTINTQILIPSNVWLHGQSKDATILQAGSELGRNRVIRILGTPDTPIVNVHISDLTVENGEAVTTHFTNNMDGIRADYVNGLLIERVHITSIQGAFCIAFKHSKEVRIIDSLIDNYTYAGVYALEANDHVWIERNDIGGSTCTSAANGCHGYTFASGSEIGHGNSDPYTTNLWVNHNFFHDSPYWECLDSHGGQHVWFEDNTLQNCATGINASLNSSILTSPLAASDYHILRNVVYQCSPGVTSCPAKDNCTNCFGLALTSRDPQYPVMDAEVSGNIFYGFGNVRTNLAGVITMHGTRNADVNNNKFYNWNSVAIMAINDDLNARIENNTAYDMVGAFDTAMSSMIQFRGGRNQGIMIDENLLSTSSKAVAPAHMVHNMGQNNQMKLGSHNRATYVTSDLYSSRSR